MAGFLSKEQIEGRAAEADFAKIQKKARMKKASASIAMAQTGASLLGVDSSSAGGAALGGALEGAGAGAQFGITGAVIGGVIGGVAGGLGASAARKEEGKKAKARAQAQHAQNLAGIEQEKDRKIQGALENMKSAFSKNLQSNRIVKL